VKPYDSSDDGDQDYERPKGNIQRLWKSSFDTVGKSSGFPQVTTKQIITLSLAIVALTIIFFKDFAPGASALARVLIIFAWIMFFVSIVFGVLCLLELTEAEPSTP
jgi:CBS domain containing-hemolysin-like protein